MFNSKFIALVLTLGFTAVAPIAAKADLANPETSKKPDSPERIALKAARNELQAAQKAYNYAWQRSQVGNANQQQQWRKHLGPLRARVQACEKKALAAQKADSAVRRAEAQEAEEAATAARNARNAKAREEAEAKKAAEKAAAVK